MSLNSVSFENDAPESMREHTFEWFEHMNCMIDGNFSLCRFFVFSLVLMLHCHLLYELLLSTIHTLSTSFPMSTVDNVVEKNEFYRGLSAVGLFLMGENNILVFVMSGKQYRSPLIVDGFWSYFEIKFH